MPGGGLGIASVTPQVNKVAFTGVVRLFISGMIR